MEVLRLTAPQKGSCAAIFKESHAAFFWNYKGIILTDYLTYGHSITGDYYRSFLVKLRQQLKVKRRGKVIKSVRL